ncbi:MAG: NUDIX hydrolase [Myxococcota bacterium]|nr:NUDIX hydrolase [Myxococcota bacterium]
MQTLVTKDIRQSAGLLLIKGHKALVLKRSKRSGNGGTWGLPGGRVEHRESWYRAAQRESIEELKSVPAHGIVGTLSLHRAQRLYAIFACRSQKKVLKAWAPILNHEHDDWRWVSYRWMRDHRSQLHPVLRKLVATKAGRTWIQEMMTETTVDHALGGRRRTDR